MSDIVGYLVKSAGEKDLQVICPQHDPSPQVVENRLTYVPNGTTCYLCKGIFDGSRWAGDSAPSEGRVNLPDGALRREALHHALQLIDNAIGTPTERAEDLIKAADIIEKWLSRPRGNS